MRATFPLATLLALLAFAASQIHAQSLTTLYSFRGSTDGISPYAGLVMDKVANLYGTTRNGGSFDYGTVFKLDTAGEVIVLHSFTFSDGAYPTAAMVMDKTGNLYGTTVGGSVRIVSKAAELSSSWIRPATRLCCTALRTRPMGRLHPQV